MLALYVTMLRGTPAWLGIMRDGVSRNANLAHLINELQYTLPFRALTTRTDSGTVRDSVVRNASLAHLIEELQCTLPLCAHSTRTDTGIRRDGVVRRRALSHTH